MRVVYKRRIILLHYVKVGLFLLIGSLFCLLFAKVNNRARGRPMVSVFNACNVIYSSLVLALMALRMLYATYSFGTFLEALSATVVQRPGI